MVQNISLFISKLISQNPPNYSIDHSYNNEFRLKNICLLLSKSWNCNQKTYFLLVINNKILNMFLMTVGKPAKQITTGDIRYYLARYMADRKVEKITLDNQRRALSAFFNDITVLWTYIWKIRKSINMAISGYVYLLYTFYQSWDWLLIL